MQKDTIIRKSSIINPSLDDLMEKVNNPFFIINIVTKRSLHYNLEEESEKAGKQVSRAGVITKIFHEIVDEKITFEEK